MDFTFSADQEELRAGVRRVVAGLAGAGHVRAAVDGDRSAVASVWQRAVELGWPGVLVPESHGGLGLGLVDAVAVLEEMGRATLPGPFLSSAVAATRAARRLGLDELLPSLASGAARGTVALEEQGHGDPVAGVRTRARRRGAGWVLAGHKPLVLDGPGADWALVAARTHDGLGTFLLERPACETVPTLDPTRRAGRLVLEETPARAVGPLGDHAALWGRVADDVAVALAAELVGVCDAALAMAVGYAKDRVQFDVPLASHQVIQHKLVDMLHRTELGRVGVHYAAWASDADDPARARAAATAKATMAEAAVAATGDNIQVHGAVGFTWDSDAHLLYKRAKQNDVLYGSAGWHRSRVADTFLATV